MTINTNMIHNVLNVLGLVIAALIGFDWAGIGFSPVMVAMIMSWLMVGDKVVKIGMNLFRDGFGGLWKVQPPVK